MRRQRAALIEQARTILNSVKPGEQLSAEDNEKYERLMADGDKLKEQIDREERLEAEEADLARSVREPGETGASQGRDPDLYRSAFTQWARGGFEACTPEQRQLLAANRAQSAVTGSAGGYTVPQGFYARITSAMKFIGSLMEAGARVINTDSGNDLPMPTANDTAQTGELLSENTPAAGQDATFSNVTLKAYKYSSKTILVPFELLQDTGVDIEAWIAEALGLRLGRIFNTHTVTGDNASKPQGIVTAAALGKTGANGQTTSVTLDDIVDLEFAIDPILRYSGRARYMMHDTTLKAVKKLKDTTGRPLWQPGIDVREPDTINGYRYVVNSAVPVMAASAKSILFGDLSAYIIRMVKAIELYRITDKYIESGQVGFLAFMRADGRLLNPGDNPVAYYANSAT